MTAPAHTLPPRLMQLYERLTTPKEGSYYAPVKDEDKPELIAILERVAETHPESIDRFSDFVEQSVKKGWRGSFIRTDLPAMANALDARPDVYDHLQKVHAKLSYNKHELFCTMPAILKELGDDDLDYNKTLLCMAKHGDLRTSFLSEKIEPIAHREPEPDPNETGMNDEEFQHAVPSWNPSMKKVPRGRRARIAELLARIHDNNEDTQKKLSKKACSLLKHGSGYYERVLEGVYELFSTSSRIANSLVAHPRALLFTETDAKYRMFIDSVKEMAKKGLYLGTSLVMSAPALLYFDEGKQYGKALDGIRTMADKSNEAGRAIMEYALKLLLHQGMDAYTRVIQDVLELAPTDTKNHGKLLKKCVAVLDIEDDATYTHLIDRIKHVSQKNKKGANALLENTPELYKSPGRYKAIGKHGWDIVADSLETIPARHEQTSARLPSFAQPLYSKLGVAGMLVYDRIAGLALKIAEHDDETASDFLDASASVVQWGRTEYLPMVADRLIPVAAKSREVAKQLLSYTNVLLRDFRLGYAVLADALARVAGEDDEYAIRLLGRAVKKDLPYNWANADLLLITSIQDPSDANLIKRVADTVKYKKEFAKVVRRFY